MMPRWRVWSVLLLASLNAAISGLLLLEHRGENRATAAVEQVCGDTQTSDCDTVNKSRYSELKGIPLAALGLTFYCSVALLLALAILGGPEARDAAAALVLLGLVIVLVIDVGLLGVQAVAIRAFCKLCLATYAINALAVVLLARARRDGSVVGQALTRAEGRVVFAGWVLGTLALAAAVFTGDRALAYHNRLPNMAVLGAPALPATTTPAAPASISPASPSSNAAASAPPSNGHAAASPSPRYEDQLRAAQEQARRLQETLDDPKKLEQYFTEKAAREFEQASVQSFNLTDTPYKGNARAPLRVVSFSDFLCPFCRQLAGAFGGYLPQAGDRIVHYFKNYPLDQSCNPNVKATTHAGACWLAAGAVCAQEHGKFWLYHDKVFATPLQAPSIKDVVKLASDAGLDATSFELCLTASQTKQKLAAEIEEGHRAGITGTPTVFINGKRLPRINDFIPMADKESARLGLGPLPKPSGS